MFTIEPCRVSGAVRAIFVGAFYRNAYTQFRSCSVGMDS